MVEAEVERDGETSAERRSYLLSMQLDAEVLALAVRCHWQVGNRMHCALESYTRTWVTLI